MKNLHAINKKELPSLEEITKELPSLEEITKRILELQKAYEQTTVTINNLNTWTYTPYKFTEFEFNSFSLDGFHNTEDE